MASMLEDDAFGPDIDVYVEDEEEVEEEDERVPRRRLGKRPPRAPPLPPGPAAPPPPPPPPPPRRYRYGPAAAAAEEEEEEEEVVVSGAGDFLGSESEDDRYAGRRVPGAAAAAAGNGDESDGLVPRRRDPERLRRLHSEAEKFLERAYSGDKDRPRRPPAFPPRRRGRIPRGRPGPRGVPDFGRTKARLERFHKEAVSFLDKAYHNDARALVPDDPEERDTEDLRAEKKVDKDKARLQRFHLEALSFLNKAYADDESLLVQDDDDVLDSPRTPKFPDRSEGRRLGPGLGLDKTELKKFHEATIMFLEKAYEQDARDAANISGLKSRRRRRSSGAERDKRRLESYYLEAVSFLDKAYNNDKSITIEEENMGAAGVVARDKARLQKYAAEAMSFLEKAYRDDQSLMVEDEDEALSSGPDEDRPNEGRRIAADRAALERYDVEMGDFLERAYMDDKAVIIEDDDSDASGNEGELYGAKILPSTKQVSKDQLVSDEESEGYGSDFDSVEEVHTDDEFQDPDEEPDSGGELDPGDPYSRGLEIGAFSSDLTDLSESNNNISNANGNSSNAKGESDATSGRDHLDIEIVKDYHLDHDGESSHTSGHTDAEEDNDVTDDSLNRDRRQPRLERDVKKDSAEKDRATAFSGVEDGRSGSIDRVRRGESATKAKQPRLDERLDNPLSDTSTVSHATGGPQSSSKDLLVDLIFEDSVGKTEWTEVPMESSFLKRVPRGKTVKIRPKSVDSVLLFEDDDNVPDKDLLTNGVTESIVSKAVEGGLDGFSRQLSRLYKEATDPRIRNHAAALQSLYKALQVSHEQNNISSDRGSESLKDLHASHHQFKESAKKEYERVVSERDAVITALENILNERSELATEVSELKSFLGQSGYGGSKVLPSAEGEEGMIDLRAELQNARKEMKDVIEESAETIALLENRLAEMERSESDRTAASVAETTKREENERTLAAKAEEIAKLTAELAKRDAALVSMRSKLSEQEDSAGSLEKASSSRLWTELASARAALQQAEAARDRAEKKLMETGSKKSMREDWARSRESSAEMRTLSREVSSLRQKVKEDQGHAQEMSKRLEQVSQEKQRLEEELEKLRAAKKGAGADAIYTRDFLAEGDASKGKLKSSKAAAYELMSLRIENDALKAKVERLELRQARDGDDGETDRDVQLQKLIEERNALKKSASRVEDIRLKNKALVSKVSDLERKREEARLLASKQERSLKNMQQRLDSLDSDLLRARFSSGAELEKKQSEYESEIDKLQKSLTEIKGEKDALEKKYDTEFSELQDRAEQAEKRAESADEEARKAEVALQKNQEQAKAEFEKEQRARKAAEAEKKSLEREVDAWKRYQAQRERRREEARREAAAHAARGKHGSLSPPKERKGHRLRLFR